MWTLDERRWSILVRQLAQVQKDRRISMKEVEIINYYSALVPRGSEIQIFVEPCSGKEGRGVGQQGGGAGQGDFEVGQMVEVEPHGLVPWVL